MDNLNIGFGQADITPKGSVAMIGLYSTRVTREVGTPLQAVALAISAGDSAPVYWAACDLLYITDTLIHAVCRRLTRQLPDFHRSQLMLSATHIHTGPFLKERTDTTLLSFPHNAGDALSPKACCEQAADGITAAILAAIADQEPVRTARTACEITTGYCRRVVFRDGTAQMYGDVHNDTFSHLECRDGGPSRFVYVYRDADHFLKGVIADIPCTAQVDVKTAYQHADYWHFTRECVKKELNVPIFGICACAGDLSPRDLYEEGPIDRTSEMQALGLRIGQAIVQTAATVTNTDEPAFSHVFREPRLPRWNPTPAEYQRAKAICKRLYRDYSFEPGQSPFHTPGFPKYLYSDAEVTVKRFKEQIPQVRAPIHALRIGQAVFITNPFECFVAYGDRIKAALPELDLFDVQLTDDYLGYLPTKEAVHGGGYSACLYNGSCSPVGGDQLVEESVRLLKMI